MRSRLLVPVLFAVTLVTSFTVEAQNPASLPGCEVSPEVQNILDDKLDQKLLDKLKFPERVATERKVLEDVIAKYPRELEPYQMLVNRMRSEQPDSFPQYRDRLVKMAIDNPDDPLALMLAGWVLRDKNTPESIRLLETSKTKAPNFPWPAKELAGDYFSGKRADPIKLKENIEIFFSICPSSTDNYAHWLLQKDPALQPKVAMSLRGRLEKETDPKRLREYTTLWGLEFRTRPPAEHDAVRAQVVEDLKRLQALNPKGDSEWQAFLLNGYKQSGATKETITALENRLIGEYPKSQEAEDIVRGRWEKAHKAPEDQSDAVAWAKYRKEYKEALAGWLRDYPDDSSLQRSEPFYAIRDDDSVLEKDATAALNTFLQSVKDYEPPSFWMWEYSSAAQFLVDRGWQPERALRLTGEARRLWEAERVRSLDDDNLSDEDLKNRADRGIWQRQYLDGLTLKAAKEARKPEEGLKWKASIEAAPPSDAKFQSGYWLNRARLEALKNHSQDALAYYEMALRTRQESPKAQRGKLRDDVTDEARALWNSVGGTDAAWEVWWKPAVGNTQQPAEGHWEKANKMLPAFELSDLSGKTWRLKELGGKTLLISVWATWCGPCEAELPHLEKFYEKVKDRSDIQVLTFDIDEDLGLVSPYLKEKGYTFPVLPAYSTVVTLLDGFAIPQNWLVDSQGVWRWTQIGYGGGSDADFEKEILARVEASKPSQ